MDPDVILDDRVLDQGARLRFTTDRNLSITTAGDHGGGERSTSEAEGEGGGVDSTTSRSVISSRT